jgi:epsilon-lactone hydrolase
MPYSSYASPQSLKLFLAGVEAGRDAPLMNGPIPPANEHRVLLNLHGGAFQWGADSGALVEAIPIAAVGRI